MLRFFIYFYINICIYVFFFFFLRSLAGVFFYLLNFLIICHTIYFNFVLIYYITRMLIIKINNLIFDYTPVCVCMHVAYTDS